MRKGMREIVVANLRHSNLKWLVSQAIKYFAIPASMKFMDGGALVGPLMGTIFVTYRCNSRCGMCHLTGRHRGKEIDTAGMKRIIDQLVAIGTSGIGFTGGEPLLRDDIFELIAHAKGHGIPITLNTNGILLTDGDMVDRLLQAGPDNVNISLDGAREDTHDTSRGGGGLFSRTVAGAGKLAEAISRHGAPVSLTAVTVVSEENLAELEAIVALAAETGFHRIGFMPLHDISEKNCSVAANPAMRGLSDRLRAIDTLPVENSSRYIDVMDLAFAGKPFPVRCNAGHTSLFIDPYGRIAPCLGYFQMGRWFAQTVDGEGIAELWRSPAYKALRQETSRCRLCYLNCQAELSLLWKEPF